MCGWESFDLGTRNIFINNLFIQLFKCSEQHIAQRLCVRIPIMPGICSCESNRDTLEGLYTLSPVNHSDSNQSWASVSSGMQKRVDIASLRAPTTEIPNVSSQKTCSPYLAHAGFSILFILSVFITDEIKFICFLVLLTFEVFYRLSMF